MSEAKQIRENEYGCLGALTSCFYCFTRFTSLFALDVNAA